MDTIRQLSLDELNAGALELFVYQRVDDDMISFLAEAAAEVIQCDDAAPPTTSRSSARAAKGDTPLPSIQTFIEKLVDSSNVQVATLMSSLVYLRRLKSCLQPMAKGLRCTTHRIFLATLILTAKYLNDSSPKNKHWASYSVISDEVYNFGFSRTEVNLMERQLLQLLEWNLRITDKQLYEELEYFLAPLRPRVQRRYERRVRAQMEQEQEMLQRLALQREREEEARMWMPLAQPQPAVVAVSARDQSVERHAYPTPASSRGTSRSRSRQAVAYNNTPSTSSSHSRGSSRDVSPPGLLYSSGSSYAGSNTSRATTPLSEADITSAQYQPYVYDDAAASGTVVCHSPTDMAVDAYGRPVVPAKDPMYVPGGRGMKQQQQQQYMMAAAASRQMLPYEISAEELRSLEASGRGAPAGKGVRGVFGRVFGTAR
ncbi:uncharacterized protein C8A04DRAFT_24637 [Dichotomopilus funicola]|uniref:Cyclin N-terminal domain-containing protein n=1 Tax=Dichotomopilus funicola TaxID=1934379 RepID=A0AAN6VAB8_9PEZI|nr:hypothetical protein C8A04DRAFT_24637 [Dichotomopilus funicola]